MRIILQEDWDFPIQPPIPNQKVTGSHFVGREKEVQALVNELLRKKQGSILISGYRGVGKTSLVYRALNIVREQGGDKFTFVLINASQLDTDQTDPNSKDVKIPPKTIISNLIRRLYTASLLDENLPKNLKSSIEDLYLKATATSVQIQASEHSTLASEERSETEHESILYTDKLGQLIWVICFAIAATLAGVNFPDNFLWLQKLSILVLSFPTPFGISLLMRRRKLSTLLDNQTKEAHKEYTHDNNTGNLEFDLEKIHRALNSNDRKVIYVIDELDKYADKKINEVFEYFKNFFTLSSAIFIFIGGEKLHKKFGEQAGSGDEYRPSEYTLFTQYLRQLWTSGRVKNGVNSTQAGDLLKNIRQ